MELYSKTACELATLLRTKQVSSMEITKSVQARIAAVEETIGGYITLTPEAALACAKKVDEKIAKGESIAPLAGIPMAIKDNICTKGIKTTCASKMLENFIPPYDAFAAKKLQDADAPMLGKLNMDEFAMGGSTENSYFKKTKNPYDTTRVPGGSSGGSAAAVASSTAIYTLGSDTGGSIRQPAAYCGVVGLKPTYGLVSRFGLVAFASSLDQIGPVTKDVADCALVLEAIAGHDTMDSTSGKAPESDYTNALDKPIKGLKIGVPTEYMGEGINAEIRDSLLAAIGTYKGLGAEIEYFSLSTAKYALPAYYIISSAEASSNLARYDGIKYGFRAGEYESLDDMYKKTRSEGFGAEVKRRIMLGTYALSSGYYDAYYKKAQQVKATIRRDFDTAFSKYDVILTPTTPNVAFAIGEKTTDPLQMYLEDICTVSINIAGLPAISLPCGFNKEGMPIGMQLIGKAFDEKTLLKTARAFEKATPFHTASPRL